MIEDIGKKVIGLYEGVEYSGVLFRIASPIDGPAAYHTIMLDENGLKTSGLNLKGTTWAVDSYRVVEPHEETGRLYPGR